MNDRFKFRVAIRQDNGTFKVCDVGIIWFMCDKIIVEYSYVADANHGKLGRAVIDGENAILLQCTGVRGKNGNLIYEGDVIQEDGINRYIHWHDGGWCYSVRYDSKCHWCLRKEDVENAEIIGNIHDDQFREVTKKVGTSMSQPAEGQ